MTTISKASTISVGLVITLAGALWHQAQTGKQVDFNTEAITHIEQRYDAKFDLIITKLAAIDVIRSQLDDLRKPIVNTQLNVKHVNKMLSRSAHDSAFNNTACDKDSYSMTELGR